MADRSLGEPLLLLALDLGPPAVRLLKGPGPDFRLALDNLIGGFHQHLGLMLQGSYELLAIGARMLKAMGQLLVRVAIDRRY